ncbi:transcriptional regulator, TetR family [Brevibacterium mcbrellneri ATCC 49030]|uniref:Transcriptional regulator, TetR family n=1 Tax=Brevibacterium mcbrellneri ATCC 49030 TaxID=585530 RepID=D4YQB3_9MICO|nr:transcriptional regulator, TetR family [Brevibacterium mcbrellneri ATCC 49030]
MYTGGMDTRRRLLDATQDLLWERGYAATSPKDILSRAAAGQGSMYHHFSGKQDLAVAALEASATAMRDDVDALLRGEGTATERLVAYLERQRDSLRGCRMGRMTYDADVLSTPELLQPVSATLAWLVETIGAVVSEGIDAGEFSSETDAHQLASMVVATVQGGYVLARAQQDPAEFDAAVHGATTLLRTWSQR